jgi:single-stranded-DNA-specific exonuclease
MDMSGSGTAFLGVEQSALGRRWADRLDETVARMAGAIADSHGLSSTLARILAARGVDIAGVESFLNPRIRDLMPDPSVLIDMDRAVARLAQAIKTHESVAIFGDYDVDGACSAALLAEYLTAFGLSPRIHIPDRLTEGYGPNEAAIEMLRGKGATLLICVDCGTSGHTPLDYAKSTGMDVLVLDHHQAPEILPDVTALVNPNRLDDLSGLGHLCAAGVVFLTLAALNRALRAGHDVPDLMAALDLVALATVADVVPLTGLNRAFVAQGLKVMRGRTRPGLAALADVSRLQEMPEAWHLGFLLGPRINAGGRIGDAALGARLLLAPDRDAAQPIAEQLDHLNHERQAVEEAMLIEAEEEALRQLGMAAEASDQPVLIVSGTNWHPGIVGIIAGRLKERFRRPAFAFAVTEEGATGSARSITGVDLGAAVRAAVSAGVARKGGGHAMAAGMTLPPDGLPAFTAFMEAELAVSVAAMRGRDALLMDAALTAESLTLDFFNDMARASPFGQGNPEPLFALPSHKLVDVLTLKGGHIKAILTSSGGARIEAMAFRAMGKPLGHALITAKGKTIHVAAHIARDTWGGREKVSLRLVDIALAR